MASSRVEVEEGLTLHVLTFVCTNVDFFCLFGIPHLYATICRSKLFVVTLGELHGALF